MCELCTVQYICAGLLGRFARKWGDAAWKRGVCPFTGLCPRTVPFLCPLY